MGSLALPSSTASLEALDSVAGDVVMPAAQRQARVTSHAITRRTLPSPAHVPALDALRGIAVLLVLARHSSALESSGGVVSQAILGAMRGGWIGVDLFFALSGFLITGILIDTRGTPHSLRNFYARRTLRIFPLYFTFLAIVFFVGPLTSLATNPEFRVLQDNQGWLWSYLTNVLIAWKGDLAVPLHLGHLWSLGLEEQFYLVWPCIVLLVPSKAVGRVCLALSVAAVLLRTALVIRSGWGVDAAYMMMPARLDALLLGGCLAVLVRSPAGLARVRRWQRPVTLAAVALLVAIAGWRQGMVRNDPYMQIAGYAALSLVAVSLIVGALPGSGALTLQRLLAAPPLQSIGKYSYAVYVVQYPIILWLETMLDPMVRRWSGDSSLVSALAIFAVATLLAYTLAR